MAYISFQPTDFFNTLLYTGNGSAGNAQTGVGFAPDIVWIKSRSNAQKQCLFDTVRGVQKVVYPSENSAEVTDAALVTAFGSDGYTVGTDSDINGSGWTYANWNWKCGTTSGLSGGTITPTGYSFNTTSQCSVITYTGNATSGATVPHGLGAKPAAILVKKLDGSVDSWAVYHESLGATKFLELDVVGSVSTSANRWNDTEPTTSLFTLGNSSTVNASGNKYVAYCFAEVKGFSSFGPFTGNASTDGPFCYTGFRPAYVMIKNTSASEAWNIWDNKRNTPVGSKNAAYTVLEANSSAAETNGSTGQVIDMLSNGFKVRTTSTEVNASGQDMVYFAFAEFPFVSSNSKAGTAR